MDGWMDGWLMKRSTCRVSPFLRVEGSNAMPWRFGEFKIANIHSINGRERERVKDERHACGTCVCGWSFFAPGECSHLRRSSQLVGGEGGLI